MKTYICENEHVFDADEALHVKSDPLVGDLDVLACPECGSTEIEEMELARADEQQA